MVVLLLLLSELEEVLRLVGGGSGLWELRNWDGCWGWCSGGGSLSLSWGLRLCGGGLRACSNLFQVGGDTLTCHN